MAKYLKRNGQSFIDENGNTVTELFYYGTHQIVLTGDCIDPVLDIISSLDKAELLIFDNDSHCYIVAPYLDAKSFFELVVKPVEAAVAGISKDDGSYIVRPKIPATPDLPATPDDAHTVAIGGTTYYQVVVHLGRGYGNRWSKVTILMARDGREVSYNVQRYLNKVTGAKEDGEAKTFTGIGAQWQAVCFAYGISPSEAKTKEAAQRAKKFVYAVVGELMDRLWSDQPQSSYLEQWERSALAAA